MTNNEVKEIIINNQMTYNDFAKRFNLSIDNAIRIFQHLDLKKCSKGKDCINPNGPIQSRKNFHKNKRERDGLISRCIRCQKQKDRQYYQNNKEYLNQRARQYHQINKDYFNQLHRQYHQDNKEYRKQRDQQNYQNNREYYIQRAHQYQQNNSKHLSQKAKEYGISYAKFDTFNNRILYVEKTRRGPNNLDLIQVKCTYCNSWFNPINRQVQARINALEGKEGTLGAENRFYCSNECKQACPIYHQIKYSKDDPKYLNNLGTSREVQAELRQLVFERDNWTCQKCYTHKDNLAIGKSLHCHHVEGIRHEPLESADEDMCLTVCDECHKKIHQIPGCRSSDMQCKLEDSKIEISNLKSIHRRKLIPWKVLIIQNV